MRALLSRTHTHTHTYIHTHARAHTLSSQPRHDPTDGNLKSHNDFLDEYSVANGHEPGKGQKLWDSAEERNPPLLETQYRLGHGQELNLDNELKLREPQFFVEATSSAYVFPSNITLKTPLKDRNNI